jgi:hypothetical protein
MEQQHRVKTATIENGKRRLKFVSQKQRSQKASADVYRSKRRRRGDGNQREHAVHHPRTAAAVKTSMQQKIEEEKQKRLAAKVSTVSDADLDEDNDEEAGAATSSSTFAEELDMILERNGTEVFQGCYKELWPLVRSLPELLHHKQKVTELLLKYTLFVPKKKKKFRGEDVGKETGQENHDDDNKDEPAIHFATLDVLHLLGVLARDLRHEVHGLLYSTILPRLFNDVLGRATNQVSNVQVAAVEAIFRTVGYFLRYDVDSILKDDNGTLESMRPVYGATLGHPVALVRRLAAETWSPLLRKLSQPALEKHAKRVVKAVASACHSSITVSNNSGNQKQCDDVIQGVALLFFYTARGLPGRLHSSKGMFLVDLLLKECMVQGLYKPQGNDDGIITAKQGYVATLVNKFMSDLCRHYSSASGKRQNNVNFDPIWNKLYEALDKAIGQLMEHPDTTLFHNKVLSHSINLICECLTHKEGVLFESASEDVATQAVAAVERLMHQDTYRHLDTDAEAAVLKLLCTTYETLPQEEREELSDSLPTLLSSSVLSGKSTAGDKCPVPATSPAVYVAQNLLPQVPSSVAEESLLPSLLSTAAQLATTDSASNELANNSTDEALRLLHTIAAVYYNDHETDELDVSSQRVLCHLPDDTTYKALLDLCVMEGHDEDATNSPKRLMYALPCIVFMSRVGAETDKARHSGLKKLTQWLSKLHKRLHSKVEVIQKRNDTDQEVNDDVRRKEDTILKGMTLDAFGRACNVRRQTDTSKKTLSDVKDKLDQAADGATKFLLAHPTSKWALRGVAALVDATKDGIAVQDNALLHNENDMFEALTPNLQSRDHDVRLYSLLILNEAYPTKAFVVDNADVDYGVDDLDEEGQDEAGVAKSKVDTFRTSGSVRGGSCDLLQTLLEIERMPLSFDSERDVVTRIQHVEVMGRSGSSLPIVYAEAASHYLLGLLAIRYAPLWYPARQAFVALAADHPTLVWPALFAKVKEVMVLPTSVSTDLTMTSTNEDMDVEEVSTIDEDRHRDACLEFEDASEIGALNASKAMEQERDYSQNVIVDKRSCTDVMTLFEQVWGFVEGVPDLAANKSKNVVPLFLSFLHYEYYSGTSASSPDARELNLQAHVTEWYA